MPEFDLISRFLKPLAVAEGALELGDDAAFIAPENGCQLVVSKDLMVEGVHFDKGLSPTLVAQKLLRVNLSDLAAMGATPRGYFLGLGLPKSMSQKHQEQWLTDFVAGLAVDQKIYDISLLGGDTVAVNSEIVLSLTIMGEVPENKALRRNGAQVGDAIFITGTLGDGALGLRLNTAPKSLKPVDQAFLRQRLDLPTPQLDVGQALRGIAHSAIDISDGCVADCGHILKASKVAATLWLDAFPLSNAAQNWRGAEPDLLANFWPFIYAGGDDYELLFTAPPSKRDEINRLSENSGVKISEIGLIGAGFGVTILDKQNKPIEILSKGYEHL